MAWTRVNGRLFQKMYVENFLVYEGKNSQQSLHMFKFCAIAFLCKLEMVKQKVSVDLRQNDPNTIWRRCDLKQHSFSSFLCLKTSAERSKAYIKQIRTFSK